MEYLFEGKRWRDDQVVQGAYFEKKGRHYIITDIVDTDHALFGNKSKEVELYVVHEDSIRRVEDNNDSK